MRILRAVSLIPFAVYLVCVLVPAGTLCYALAALARTMYENTRSGWRENGIK